MTTVEDDIPTVLKWCWQNFYKNPTNQTRLLTIYPIINLDVKLNNRWIHFRAKKLIGCKSSESWKFHGVKHLILLPEEPFWSE